MAFGFSQAPVDQDAADAGAYSRLPDAMQAGGAYSVIQPSPIAPIMAAAQFLNAPQASPTPPVAPAVPPQPDPQPQTAQPPQYVGQAGHALNQVLGVYSSQGTPSSASVVPIAPPAPYKPGFWETLINHKQGQGWGEAQQDAIRAHYLPYQQALAMRQFQNAQAVVEANADKLTPGQLAAARADPLAFQAQVEATFAPATLKEGDTRIGVGMSPVTAPKLVFNNGRYGTQLPGSYSETGNAGPTLSATPGGGVIDTTGLLGVKPVSSVPVQTTIAPGASLVQTGSAPGMGGASAGPQAASAPAGTPALAGMMAPNGKLDPQAFYRNFVLKHEGGYNPSDMNGSPTMYGFNQKANPDIDVKTLTPDAAAARFASTYFPQSGAQNLPPALAAIHADTSFINPAAANRFLRRSGGDPAAYMQLRQQWMANQVKGNPAARPYAKAWAQRNADLSQLAGIGQGATSAPGGATVLAQGKTVSAPTFNPSTQQWEQTGPDGAVTKVAPPAFGIDQQRGLVNDVEGTEEWKGYSAAADALNGLHAAMAKMAGNNGVIDNAATDSYYRNMAGGVARPGGVKVFMDHLGLPQDLQGKISSVVGDGYLTPTTLRQMDSVMTSYAQAKAKGAARVLRDRQGIAKGVGGSFNMEMPTLDPTPKVKWLDQGSQTAGPSRADIEAEMRRRGMLK